MFWGDIHARPHELYYACSDRHGALDNQFDIKPGRMNIFMLSGSVKQFTFVKIIERSASRFFMRHQRGWSREEMLVPGSVLQHVFYCFMQIILLTKVKACCLLMRSHLLKGGIQ
jgi:hypothetical protein